MNAGPKITNAADKKNGNYADYQFLVHELILTDIRVYNPKKVCYLAEPAGTKITSPKNRFNCIASTLLVYK